MFVENIVEPKFKHSKIILIQYNNILELRHRITKNKKKVDV